MLPNDYKARHAVLFVAEIEAAALSFLALLLRNLLEGHDLGSGTRCGTSSYSGF